MKYPNLIELNGEIILDLTKDTISADKLAYGITAHDASGQPIVGLAAIGDNTPDLSSATVALGEDGKVYAFVNGQLVGVGVAIEDLKAPVNPDEPTPDEPTPDEPDAPVVTSLAAGIYPSGTIKAYKAGTLDTTTTTPTKTWEQAVMDGNIVVEGTVITGNSDMDLITWDDSSGRSIYYDVVIPEGITDIGNGDPYDYGVNGFNYCMWINAVLIADTVTNIGYGGFSGALLSDGVYFGENSQLTTIGQEGFYMIQANTFTLPNSIQDIGIKAFWYSAMQELRYDGTVEEWDSVYKWSGWLQDTSIVQIICTDGNVNTTSYDKTSEF